MAAVAVSAAPATAAAAAPAAAAYLDPALVAVVDCCSGDDCVHLWLLRMSAHHGAAAIAAIAAAAAAIPWCNSECPRLKLMQLHGVVHGP